MVNSTKHNSLSLLHILVLETELYGGQILRKLAECRPKSIALHILPMLATELPLITIFGSEWKRQRDALHLYIR